MGMWGIAWETDVKPGHEPPPGSRVVVRVKDGGGGRHQNQTDTTPRNVKKYTLMEYTPEGDKEQTCKMPKMYKYKNFPGIQNN